MVEDNKDALSTVRYVAAGGVVVHEERVLVLRRSSRGEVRLPKGHVEPGESLEETALREVCEESGCQGPLIVADLGRQIVTFDVPGRRVVRTEQYFLMRPVDGAALLGESERQFAPEWMAWDEALAALTFEPEREWVRRARRAWEG